VKKKILLRAPLLTRSGYGEQARFALRSLRSRTDLFDIYIQPLQWGHTSWLNEESEERKWIDFTIEKTIAYIQQGGQFDVSLQVTIPNEWEQLAPINVGYTAGIETTKVAHQWIEKGNLMDRIIVVSNHSKYVYANTEYTAQNNETGAQSVLRLQTPIETVNYPVKIFEKLSDLDFQLKHDFNFLVVAQFGPRKNLQNTLKWFVEEFHDEEVGLVVKTNMIKNSLMDREKTHENLTHVLSGYPDRKCKIYLLHGDMTDEQIHSLYKHPQIKAFLALPHGEGFGLPIFEAAYSGLPVVATGWSGQLDFLTDEQGKEHFYNVAFDLQPVQDDVVWEGVLIKEAMWAFPRESSAKEQMRLCYQQLTDGTAANDAEVYVKALHERFSEEKMYAAFLSAAGEEEFNIESWLDDLNVEEIE